MERSANDRGRVRRAVGDELLDVDRGDKGPLRAIARPATLVTMARLALLAAVLLVAASCTTSPLVTSPTAAPSSPGATPSATARGQLDRSVVYLSRDRLPPVALHVEGAGRGATPEERVRSRVEALFALARPADPSLANIARTVKARLASVALTGELATLDFTVPGDDWGTAGSAGTRAFVQQLVYTACEEPGIRRVLVTQNGGREAIIGGEGLVVDRPATREDVLGYAVKASREVIRTYEGTPPQPPQATLSSRHSVEEIAPALARLVVELERPGAIDRRWLPTFDVAVAPNPDELGDPDGGKWQLTLTVYDGSEAPATRIIDRTPLRGIRVLSQAGTRGTRYRLALDDLRPWRVGMLFDPVRIVVDVGGDPDLVAANLAVYRPRWGETVAEGFVLSGMTRAFEATYNFRVLDSRGRPVASGFGTASLGTSAVWGVFERSSPEGPRGPSTLEVFLTSPKDGSISDVVRVPLAVTAAPPRTGTPPPTR